MEIATLMTCHNRREKTLGCLDALFKAASKIQNYNISVYLVDDGSTDGTSDAVKNKYPLVNLIQGNGNMYWNGGMHLAWSQATKKNPDYYLWLNDDTFIMENCISELLACSELNNNKVIVCGATCSFETRQFTYGGRSADWKPILPDNTFQKCNIINGNCVLLSKEVFEKVGLLDPIFPHAIGDFDYGLRAKKLGVEAISSRIYIGYCENNASLPMWCLPNVPLIKRIKNLYSPLGYSHPMYYFIYEERHFGVFAAVKHFLSIHLRLLMPRLWK